MLLVAQNDEFSEQWLNGEMLLVFVYSQVICIFLIISFARSVESAYCTFFQFDHNSVSLSNGWSPNFAYLILTEFKQINDFSGNRSESICLILEARFEENGLVLKVLNVLCKKNKLLILVARYLAYYSNFKYN